MKLSKRTVDALEPQSADYFSWDDELPGFGIRVYTSGRKTYIVQYRNIRRTRRITLGKHGPLTPEEARRLAKIHLGDIASGGDPAEERKTRRSGMTIRELCDRYLDDCEIGLIPGKRRMPKKASTIAADRSRIGAHIIPLLGTRLVKEIGRAEVNQFMRDVASGKARRDLKTKPRGRSIVRGGLTTAGRTVGLLGGILTYAVRNGIIDHNPVRYVVKPASRVRQRHLSEGEYRTLGDIIRRASEEGRNETALEIMVLLALTGCRRGEIEKLRWEEVDEVRHCLRFNDTKEGRSVRPVGGIVFKLLNRRRPAQARGYVFEGAAADKPYEGLPKVWNAIVPGKLEAVTPHVLRHSFASTANALGYTEATIAALLGHAAGSITSRYVHVLDSHLIAAADAVSAHIAGLLDMQVAEAQQMRAMFAAWGEATKPWSVAAE